jgi:hypothetical protein
MEILSLVLSIVLTIVATSWVISKFAKSSNSGLLGATSQAIVSRVEGSNIQYELELLSELKDLGYSDSTTKEELQVMREDVFSKYKDVKSTKPKA